MSKNFSERVEEVIFNGGFAKESDVFTFPLNGVIDNQVNLLGERRTVASGQNFLIASFH